MVVSDFDKCFLFFCYLLQMGDLKAIVCHLLLGYKDRMIDEKKLDMI